MSDLFKKPTSGQRSNGIPAEFYSLLVDMAKWYLTQRAPKTGDVQVPLDVTIKIKNVSGSPLTQYAVVVLGTALVKPAADAAYFFGDAIFESAAPSKTLPFAILQQPAAIDAIVEAVFVGVTLAQVQITAGTDGWAAPINADYAKLKSQAASGPVRILWLADSGASESMGLVSILDVDASVNVASADGTVVIAPNTPTSGITDLAARVADLTHTGILSLLYQAIKGLKEFSDGIISHDFVEIISNGIYYSDFGQGSTQPGIYGNPQGVWLFSTSPSFAHYVEVGIEEGDAGALPTPTHCLFRLIGLRAGGESLDPQPSFAVNGNIGKWTTDAMGNVFCGGLLITPGAIGAPRPSPASFGFGGF